MPRMPMAYTITPNCSAYRPTSRGPCVLALSTPSVITRTTRRGVSASLDTASMPHSIAFQTALQADRIDKRSTDKTGLPQADIELTHGTPTPPTVAFTQPSSVLALAVNR